ncbi:phage tail fiber C-terminal domain-containing protein, partial [Escherichia coli]
VQGFFQHLQVRFGDGPASSLFLV